LQNGAYDVEAGDQFHELVYPLSGNSRFSLGVCEDCCATVRTEKITAGAMKVTDRKDKMAIGAIISTTGGHVASWRHPECPADGAVNLQRYVEVARLAESAKLDFIFQADNLALKDSRVSDLARTASSTLVWDPVVLMTALAMVTERIGLVATVSSTYSEPYVVARQFAALDQVSNGRAGWNLVTSQQPIEARNFSRETLMPHEERYARAGEFADVVRGLWDSWEDDALIRNKEDGFYFDPDKLHVLNHKGDHFQVRGPLNAARPPQGNPVIFQAGSSGPGIDLAGRTADCVFTAQPNHEGAVTFYKKVKDAAIAHGRNPDHVKVVPGIFLVVGETEAEAQAKYQRMQDLIHPDTGLSILSAALGGKVDLSQYPLDAPVPEIPDTEGGKTFQHNLLTIAREENLTLRQLYQRYAGGFGHRQLIGSVKQVADALEQTFLERGADGFAITQPVLPLSLQDMAGLLIPELQRRGLFRTEYEGAHLRDHLGIPRPAHPAVAG